MWIFFFFFFLLFLEFNSISLDFTQISSGFLEFPWLFSILILIPWSIQTSLDFPPKGKFLESGMPGYKGYLLRVHDGDVSKDFFPPVASRGVLQFQFGSLGMGFRPTQRSSRHHQPILWRILRIPWQKKKGKNRLWKSFIRMVGMLVWKFFYHIQDRNLPVTVKMSGVQFLECWLADWSKLPIFWLPDVVALNF